MTEETKTSIWDPLPMGTNKPVTLSYGPCKLYCSRRGNDLLVRETRDESEEESKKDHFSENQYRRYAFEVPVEKIQVLPAPPDRPLVVRPRHPLVLSPGSRIDFFVSVPIDLRIRILAKSKDAFLERIRTELLSDTWFGDTADGVLSYALKSSARREVTELVQRKENRAICSLHIDNESSIPLKCEKFCLRLQYCGMWEDPTGLWFSPVYMRYRGAEQLTAIEYKQESPANTSHAKKITEPELKETQSLLRRTFGITGLGNLING